MTVDTRRCQAHAVPWHPTFWFDGKVWHNAVGDCRFCWQARQQVKP
jgi:hypothetical protein